MEKIGNIIVHLLDGKQFFFCRRTHRASPEGRVVHIIRKDGDEEDIVMTVPIRMLHFIDYK